jgi:hypothetical protein
MKLQISKVNLSCKHRDAQKLLKGSKEKNFTWLFSNLSLFIFWAAIKRNNKVIVTGIFFTLLLFIGDFVRMNIQ